MLLPVQLDVRLAGEGAGVVADDRPARPGSLAGPDLARHPLAEQLGREVVQEAGRRHLAVGGAALAVADPPPGEREGEPLRGAGHADVAEPPLLVERSPPARRGRRRPRGARRGGSRPPPRPGRPPRTRAPWRRASVMSATRPSGVSPSASPRSAICSRKRASGGGRTSSGSRGGGSPRSDSSNSRASATSSARFSARSAASSVCAAASWPSIPVRCSTSWTATPASSPGTSPGQSRRRSAWNSPSARRAAGLQPLHRVRLAQRREERGPARRGVGPQPLQGLVADAAGRPVHHALHVEVGAGREGQPEVGGRVLHLGPIVEAGAADDDVRDARRPERRLDGPGLGVGPVEDGDLVARRCRARRSSATARAIRSASRCSSSPTRRASGAPAAASVQSRFSRRRRAREMTA